MVFVASHMPTVENDLLMIGFFVCTQGLAATGLAHHHIARRLAVGEFVLDTRTSHCFASRSFDFGPLVLWGTRIVGSIKARFGWLLVSVLMDSAANNQCGGGLSMSKRVPSSA